MKAYLKNYRQSPRKIRLVAELIKGKSVREAENRLDFLAKRGSLPLRKLLDGARANASLQGVDKEDLFIKEVRVDKGTTLKRTRPAAMGAAHKLNKRSSHITLVLGKRELKPIAKAKKPKAKKE